MRRTGCLVAISGANHPQAISNVNWNRWNSRRRQWRSRRLVVPQQSSASVAIQRHSSAPDIRLALSCFFRFFFGHFGALSVILAWLQLDWGILWTTNQDVLVHIAKWTSQMIRWLVNRVRPMVTWLISDVTSVTPSDTPPPCPAELSKSLWRRQRSSLKRHCENVPVSRCTRHRQRPWKRHRPIRLPHRRRDAPLFQSASSHWTATITSSVLILQLYLPGCWHISVFRLLLVK